MISGPDPHLVSALVYAVYDLPPEQRDRYLAEHCADSAVRAEVAGLLEAAGPPPPSTLSFGRYRVERVLGRGGFGVVYLARDEELQRLVAVKVPRRDLFTAADAAVYLREARIVAGLAHPNIVPVFDLDVSAGDLRFIVSKYIEGSTLAQKIAEDRLRAGARATVESARLVKTVAETLVYIHRQGLVHRDIKPANILLDTGGQPHVADFGLALREEDLGRGPKSAGTPAYMSPEQASGEGNRVTARSDIYSLGVVFYELLTGRRPFQGATTSDLLEQIRTQDAPPPRQWDPAIPKELERICLQALERRAAERYSTAWDMAEDLRLFLEGENDRRPGDSGGILPADPDRPVTVVPKGLQSFDRHDAEFFLELLPGPRDREGLPKSIRFWKTRIEETDAEDTFGVGLLYGPSGCGKSSLVKAGLLPRLAGTVHTVYVEATAKETEARLLRGVRKLYPPLSAEAGLVEALSALRRGAVRSSGKKVLLVLDQFEQWLHENIPDAKSELVRALRQCDGANVQGVLLVRDDFLMRAERFLAELETPPVVGHNAAVADLFDPRHARKVLAAFGRAYGALPEAPRRLSREEEAFLDRAIDGLTREGKVVPVRLALFAEMVKDRPWTPAALQAVGGTEGVGLASLVETFNAPTTRRHQRAARAVLKALLPESGSDLKGSMRSHAELLAASGYATRPQDFDALLRILNAELRLITPTDPEGAEEVAHPPGDRYYQLTHDYLVRSLREWLDQGMKQTWHGRAVVRLHDLSRSWSLFKDGRYVPNLIEHAMIRAALLRRRHRPTREEADLLRVAARRHGVWLAVAVVLLSWVAWAFWTRYQIQVDLQKMGVNVQVLEPGKAPTSWVGRLRARADHGYYRYSTDNWGKGQFQQSSLQKVVPKLRVSRGDLVWMDFTELESLTEPVTVADLPAVEELEFENCRNLPSLTLTNLPKLEDLRLSGCYSLTKVTGLGELPLKKLSLPEYTKNPVKPDRRKLAEFRQELQQLSALKFLAWRDVSSLDDLEALPPNVKNTLEEIDIGLPPAGIRLWREGEIKNFQPLFQLTNLKRIYVSRLTEQELGRLAEQFGFAADRVYRKELWNVEKWTAEDRDKQNKNRPVYSILRDGATLPFRRLELIHNEPTSVRPPTSVQAWANPLPEEERP